MFKIGIIGTGKIGSALAFKLLFNKSVGEIRLFNRDTTKLEAIIMSLSISSFQIRKDVIIKELDFNSLDDIDIIIIAIKDTYDLRELSKSKLLPSWLPRNLRYSGIINDYYQLIDVAEKLKQFKGIIGVITNPVEIATKIISEHTKSELVFGFGASLDSSRFAFEFYLEQNTVLNTNEIQLFGEHGYNLNIVKKLSSEALKNEKFKSIIDNSTNIGFNIVKKIGYTLYDCIISFSKDIDWLLNKDLSHNSYKSFAVSKDNIIISQPLLFDNVNNKYVCFDSYNLDELKIIKNINERLIGIYNNIINEARNIQIYSNMV
jgi:L-lactate dehydrogenase